MKCEFRIDHECPSDWNKQLEKSNLGNIFNTFEYSRYPQSRLGWVPSFLSMIDSKGNILAQVVLFNVMRKNFGFLSKLTKNISIQKLSRIKWIFGPVIISEKKQEITDLFLEYMLQTGKKLDGSTHPLLNIDLSSNNFKNWSTFLIDLKQSEESILKNMDKNSVRKNIKRSQERGVTISQITDSTIYEYHEILNTFRAENNLSTYDFKDTKELWDLLNPLGFNGFFAKKDGVIIGGILFSAFNGYINEWGIARSKIDFEEKLYSQDLLKWSIIEWGIKNNQNFYDLSGVNPNPQNKKEEGIFRYKRKWGGLQKNYFLVRN